MYSENASETKKADFEAKPDNTHSDGVKPRMLQQARGARCYDYRVFISHRGPEKATVAFPMMAMFSCFCGSDIAFFDQISLSVGETNLSALSEGVSGSRTCLAVLSASFFQSKWCVEELAAFIDREYPQGAPPVIPLFYDLSPETCRHLPAVACQDKGGKILAPEELRMKQALAKRVGDLNGYCRNEKPPKQFVIETMLQLLQHDLVYGRAVLLPEFMEHLSELPQHLSRVYDEAIRCFETHHGKMTTATLNAFVAALRPQLLGERRENLAFKSVADAGTHTASPLHLTLGAASVGLLAWYASTIILDNQSPSQPTQHFSMMALLLLLMSYGASRFYFKRPETRGTKSQADSVLKRLDNLPMLRHGLVIGAYRQKLLGDIDALLSKTPSSIPVLIGGVGIGKSHLACCYAQSFQRQRYLAQHATLQARYLSIEAGGDLSQQQQALEKAFRTLAKVLDLSHPLKSVEDLIAHVYEHLGRLQGNVLLIFDNVQTAAAIHPFLPPFTVNNVHLLLTTSNQSNWGAPFKPIVIVPEALAEEAFTLLKECWHNEGDRPEDDELKTLLSCIGHNPLAVKSVAFDIQRKQQSIPEYLIDLPKYLSESSVAEQEPGLVRLQAFWRMSLRTLTPAALNALRLCAYLHHRDIPKSLFKDIPWPQVMPMLSCYSMCETRLHDGDKQHYHYLQIDRLFQTFLQSYFASERREILLMLMASLESAIKMDNTLTEQFLWHAALLPHIDCVLLHWRPYRPSEVTSEQRLTHIQLLLKWANHMIQSQMYGVAESALTEAKLLLPSGESCGDKETHYQALRTLGPHYALAYARVCHYLGKCYYHTRQSLKEDTEFKQDTAERAPTSRAHLEISCCALREGMVMLERLLHDESSLALQVEKLIYQRVLALNLVEIGQTDEAEKLLLVLRDSGDALNYSICNYSLADIYISQHRYDAANICIKNAIQRLEKNTKGHWRLFNYYERQASILEKSQDYAGANVVWQEKVLASTPKPNRKSVEKAYAEFKQRHLEAQARARSESPGAEAASLGSARGMSFFSQATPSTREASQRAGTVVAALEP